MTPINSERRGRGWLSPFIYLSNNWISLAGVVIVTTATIFWLFVLPITLRGETKSPYVGILSFLVLPVPFFAGLALVPLGIWLKRKREGRSGIYPPEFPPLTWHNAELRRLVYFVGAATVANIAIASQLSYGAVNYMDSVTFCGQTCHTVMQPEYTAYQNSPHSNVECVKCHIGPGAGWFVRSKLSGVGQVFAVTFNTYPRPIPTPVHNLRPARETCESCHWPQKYGEDRVRIISKYAEDETNSLTKTVLLMKIGGGNNGIGIHGTHLGRRPGEVVVRYGHSDEARQTIPWVEYTADGAKTVYATADAKPDGAGLTMREMDCMDCHNRPSHTYDLPDRALDLAMRDGLISAALPFAKKKALEILKATYSSREDAAQKIPAAFAKYYQDSYPAVWSARRSEVTASAGQVLGIYNRNIFPDMDVTWGKYPLNIGHTDFPGCFRCHDGGHSAKDGKSITQDCNACHNLLAMDEANPKVLTDLGITEAKAPDSK
ncbi:Cytochrome c family protein [Candidatus Sulfopaludibacter sp. SbA6]|nr:Cytochrome c family protein [Candidatus Sulfopaludibacter sp. SbA6]